MAGLSRLHPHLQHAIVHDLGWRELRPVQLLTIDAVLDRANAVVLAPTAGGKTEAAIFPLLSRILDEELSPVAVLYVCPIRALLNNQEERLRSYARMVGIEVFKWHGDVADSQKQRFRREPKHILMTTPESLEVMLISQRTDARALFAGLSAVVVDEVHAFAGDDRGAHLASVLERLSAFCGRDVQRIGLSATVGNPHAIGQWLQGSSKRAFRLVDPPRPSVARTLRVEFAEELGNAAHGIAQLARGKKSLVFVESRAKAERVAQALQGSDVEVFIHHSSVSRAERTLAEKQFANGDNTAIVCTSTMELGIDVGDLDHVLQVDAPSSVASFLQRLGRTGRRDGAVPNCTFFCVSPDALLQAVALLQLAERGWVEDVKPPTLAMHVLAHQVLALILQEDGLSRHRLLPWVQAAYPFSAVRKEDLRELIDTMVTREILYEADGLLTLGQHGEKLYGRRHFFELYAVFTAPPMLRVRHGRTEIGYIQSLFAAMQDQREGPLCFRLSGKSWEVGAIEWNRGIVHVVPAKRGRVPSWLGLPGALSTALCQAMMEVLISPAPTERSWLSREAQRVLDGLREGYAGLLAPGTAPVEELPDEVVWHTFAGGAINRLLAAGLETLTARSWVAGNLSLKCKEATRIEAHEAIAKLASLDWEHVAAGAARGMARGTVSKFQPCLPEAAESRLLVDRLLDVAGTLRFLGSVSVDGRRPLARAPETPRLVDAEPALPIVVPVTRPLPPGGTLEPSNPIHWVDSAAELAEVCRQLAPLEAIGLDVETLGLGPLCLLQLAAREVTYVVDPFACGDLTPLAAVFGGERPIKIIHHAAFERRVLAVAGLPLEGVFDTMVASIERHGKDALYGHSLAALCERELGRGMDKSEQTSNWSRRPLTPEQLRYAALDAEVLLPLFDRLGPTAASENT